MVAPYRKEGSSLLHLYLGIPHKVWAQKYQVYWSLSIYVKQTAVECTDLTTLFLLDVIEKHQWPSMTLIIVMTVEWGEGSVGWNLT